MTTFYPSQPTPQFLKKYTRNVYNRVQHNAHHDHNGQQSADETPLSLQPYRSTPLVLPGAKVYQNKNLPTDCYLRHHPNPQMRAGPTHEYVDSMMKQKVADSVLHRVNGPEEAGPQQAVSNGPKLVHKQFNSPIGLYSDSNIENTIKNTYSPLSPVASSMGSSSVPSPNGTLNRPHQQLPTKIQGYKKTVVFDPLKSETYRALQESTYSSSDVREVAAPAQTRVFMPNKLVPGKKPVASFPPPDPISRIPVNAMGDTSEVIHQSNSFYRLMHSVMGETDY
jgi:hypothetical protein